MSEHLETDTDTGTIIDQTLSHMYVGQGDTEINGMCAEVAGLQATIRQSRWCVPGTKKFEIAGEPEGNIYIRELRFDLDETPMEVEALPEEFVLVVRLPDRSTLRFHCVSYVKDDGQMIDEDTGETVIYNVHMLFNQMGDDPTG